MVRHYTNGEILRRARRRYRSIEDVTIGGTGNDAGPLKRDNSVVQPIHLVGEEFDADGVQRNLAQKYRNREIPGFGCAFDYRFGNMQARPMLVNMTCPSVELFSDGAAIGQPCA